MRVPKMRERLQERRYVTEKIRDDDQQAAPVQLWNEIVKYCPKLCLSAGFCPLKFIDQNAQMADP